MSSDHRLQAIITALKDENKKLQDENKKLQDEKEEHRRLCARLAHFCENMT